MERAKDRDITSSGNYQILVYTEETFTGPEVSTRCTLAMWLFPLP